MRLSDPAALICPSRLFSTSVPSKQQADAVNLWYLINQFQTNVSTSSGGFLLGSIQVSINTM